MLLQIAFVLNRREKYVWNDSGNKKEQNVPCFHLISNLSSVVKSVEKQVRLNLIKVIVVWPTFLKLQL